MWAQSTERRGRRRSRSARQRRQAERQEAERGLKQLFSPATVNRLRLQTGYNPRLRHAMA